MLDSYWSGGYVDPGEDIDKAAVREVMEETGIQTKFKSIVAFRHGHNFNFGCSDIYVLVALTPLSTDIKFDSKEISDCQWMPITVSEPRNILESLTKENILQEYAQHPLVHDTNRHLAEKYMECDKNGTFIGLKEIQLKIKDFVRNQKVYSVNFNSEDSSK